MSVRVGEVVGGGGGGRVGGGGCGGGGGGGGALEGASFTQEGQKVRHVHSIIIW